MHGYVKEKEGVGIGSRAHKRKTRMETYTETPNDKERVAKSLTDYISGITGFTR